MIGARAHLPSLRPVGTTLPLGARQNMSCALAAAACTEDVAEGSAVGR